MNALSLLNNFEREFARPFFRAPARDVWFGDLANTVGGFYNSAMTYDEKESKWNLMVELAGVTKENIKVDTEEGYVRVSGEKTKGLNTGKFETKFNLPEDVDTEKFEASFEDGVLTVAMPLVARKTAKSITIK